MLNKASLLSTQLKIEGFHEDKEPMADPDKDNSFEISKELEQISMETVNDKLNVMLADPHLFHGFLSEGKVKKDFNHGVQQDLKKFISKKVDRLYKKRETVGVQSFRPIAEDGADDLSSSRDSGSFKDSAAGLLNGLPSDVDASMKSDKYDQIIDRTATSIAGVIAQKKMENFNVQFQAGLETNPDKNELNPLSNFLEQFGGVRQ